MEQEEINQRLTDMINCPDLPQTSITALAAKLLSHVKYNFNELPESTVDDLFLVAACLLRDMCNDVAGDVEAVRNLMKPK